MNTNTRTVSVHSMVFDRQALNLDVESLASAVKPWFDDLVDAEIAQAITELEMPETRLEAAKFLGLELIPVA